MSERVQRRLAAIVAADVAEYSRLVGDDEEGTLAALRAHRTELIDPLLVEHGGRIANTAGDSLLLEFPSAVDAVRCAASIQDGMMTRNRDIALENRIRFRVGIHVGDVIAEGEDLLGEGVNVAARLEGLSDPDGMVLSDDAYRQVRDRLDFAWQDGGVHSVKNIARPILIWRWSPSAASADSSDRALPLPDKPSIAVLPFDNMSGDADQEYFADGITEDIITALSLLRWFFVIARNSTFVFKGKAVDVKQAARELGVRYVIEGSVRKAGNRVRINVQLIDAVTGNHLWADRYDRELTDIFEVQDDITQNVTAAIEPQLLEAEAGRSRRRSGDDLDAWDLVIRARSHYWKMTEPETRTAIELLEDAVARYPDYGPAQSALAFALLFTAHMGWIPPDGTREMASDCAYRAAAIDDLDPWAHIALGYLGVIARDTDAATAAFTKAIELNPNFAAAIGWRGLACAFGGRSDDAIPDLQRAVRLSPRDPQNAVFVSATGIAHYLAGRYGEALTWTTRGVDMRPDFVAGHRIHCAVLGQLDRYDEAKAAFERARQLQPNISAGLLEATVPYAQPADMAHFLDGMRKAGLPD